ncbi:MAG: hypothetical protein P8180_10110 [Gammaproteobacteria bacterium]|jgi:hypothetical protein
MTMVERRTMKDRRSWVRDVPMTYPFVDRHGTLVTEDRRVAPDRRLRNIEVHWLPIRLKTHGTTSR